MGQKQSLLPAEGDEEPPAGRAALPSDSDILARLVMHLGNCPEQSMALSEIIDVLPKQLQMERAVVCKWLQTFTGLLSLTGDVGEERVNLIVGKPPAAGTAAPALATSGESSPTSPVTVGPVRAGPLAEGSAAAVAAAAARERESNEDETGLGNECALQLRGLPFRATLTDIQRFLGEHAHHLITSEPAIKLLLNKDGRPSGFAKVQFATQQAAQQCRDALHKRQMGDRYIEVLACSDRAGRPARGPRRETDGGAAHGGEHHDDDGKERVLQECRLHMQKPGYENILLSMLGIALSAPAREYLRRANLGLKHFLARFPHEFRVEGPKGCEKVIWTPGMSEAMAMPWNPHMMLPTPSTPRGLSSPSQLLPFGMATPSDWGSPGILAAGSMDFAAFGNAFNPYWSGAWPEPWMGSWEDGGPGAGSVEHGRPEAKSKKSPTNKESSSRSHAHLHPQSHPFSDSRADDSAALRLRGLPFSVTNQDVLAFFAQHDVVDRIAEVKNACQLLAKANGRPSGQAVVQMKSRYDAEIAQRALCNKYLGNRYIEVFVYGEGGDESPDGSPPGDAFVTPTSPTAWTDWVAAPAPPWLNMPAPPPVFQLAAPGPVTAVLSGTISQV